MNNNFSRLVNSFACAAQGIWHCLRCERNFRIHIAAACYALALGRWMRLTDAQWAVLFLTIALVLACEALNTAVEAVVDDLCPKCHPSAKIAKDAAAGAVLLCAAASIAVGIKLFWRPRRLASLFVIIFTTPWAFLAAAGSAVLALCFIFGVRKK